MAASQVFDTRALMSLQSSSQLELLDIIDQLRANGLNEHVHLPQLIVCGDQSSGKSSLLAAISGVPFPKKENLCTRFATEVILRRDDAQRENKIFVTILPSSGRSSSDRSVFDSFARELFSIEDLPETITDATDTMSQGATSRAFFADILRLEVRGPRLPQLTIVDLPGLVHSENRLQTAEDIALVNELVGKYMKQERSIILAVVSAKNDYANQIVLAKARKIDPEGRRTLGIITKPDALHPDSASERAFLDLAQNHDIKFSLGWHVVRNQDSNEPADLDRDVLEAKFFQTSRLGRLAPNVRGIGALRTRLSEVLFQQIQRELPSLIAEITAATRQTKADLARMGRNRATLSEKRMFVMDLSQRFGSLCFAACEGLYEHEFFGTSRPSGGGRRLRAAIQNASIEFAREMLDAPLALTVTGPDGLVPTVEQRARELVRTHRGKELPGTFNPALIGELFRELSRSWLSRAQDHVGKVWDHARTTVIAILDEVAEEDIRAVCVKEVLTPELDAMQQDMSKRLRDYMKAFRRHPITYNHYLTETVQEVRYTRDYKSAVAKCATLFGNSSSRLTSEDIHRIVSTIFPQNSQPDMDALAAQDLVDYTRAYYKVALKRYIDEIPSHVLEPALTNYLPRMFDAAKILDMPEDLVNAIGGESDEKRAVRESLFAKLDVLNRSNLTCKIYSNTLDHESHRRILTPAESEPGSAVDVAKDDDASSAVNVARVDEAASVVDEEPTRVETPPAAAVIEDDDWGTILLSKKDKKRR